MGAEVEQIKERVSITDVVGEYVQLRPAGQNLKAPCPFHSEKTPSFFVSPKRGTWHCFGACNEGGDIFTFLQKAEGIDFPAALKILAERAGVQLSSRQQSAQTTSHRQRLFDTLALAGSFYHEILMHQKAGEKAKAYLQKRGITEKTMEAFRLGYAPNAWDLLQSALLRKNITESEMVETGLVGRSGQGKLFDRFRGRIMFPIQDSRGRIIAFGGRIVPWHETGNEGKYVNSPETALYEKRLTVYNLHRAKQVLRKGSACIVVEGYMDVAMLVQAGIDNVVATSGTAFTEGHIKQLSRYTDTLHFAFDADAAGFKATVAATTAALAQGMNVATVVMPAGQDPADIAQDPKRAAVVFSEVKPLLSVLLHQLIRAGSNKDKQFQLESLLPLVRIVKNPIQQGQMIETIAASLHLPTDRVIHMVEEAAPIQTQMLDDQLEDMPATAPPDRAQQELLGILLEDRDVRKALFSYLTPELFLDQDCLGLYKSMQQLSETRSSFSSMQPDAIIDALPERQRPFAEGVRAVSGEVLATTSQTPLQEGRALVRSLRRKSLHASLTRLQEEVATSADAKRTAALERFRALSQELANIDNS